MKTRAGALLLMVLLPTFALSQQFKIEAQRPEFNFAGGEPSFLTAGWFISADIPLPAGFSIIGDLPFAFGKLEGGSVPTEGSTIGNIGAGLRFHSKALTIDAYLRVPLVENGFAGFVGFVSDLDRQEAFVPNIIPLIGIIRTDITAGKFIIRPVGGLTANIKSSLEKGFFENIIDAERDDIEFHLLYGAQTWLMLQKWELGAILHGRAWLTSGVNFDDSTQHQLSLHVRVTLGKAVPGVMFRFPFDENELDYVAGLNFAFSL